MGKYRFAIRSDGETHDIPYQRVCAVLTKLGYELQQKEDGAETLYIIMQITEGQ